MTENENIRTSIRISKFGHVIKLSRKNQSADITQRTRLAWVVFGKLNFILGSHKYPQYLKVKLFNQHILPVMTYWSHKWSLLKENMYKLTNAHRAMEQQQLLNINLNLKTWNEWSRSVTKQEGRTREGDWTIVGMRKAQRKPEGWQVE